MAIDKLLTKLLVMGGMGLAFISADMFVSRTVNRDTFKINAEVMSIEGNLYTLRPLNYTFRTNGSLLFTSVSKSFDLSGEYAVKKEFAGKFNVGDIVSYNPEK